MRVHLIDNYYMTSDPNNFILVQEVKVQKDGKNKGKKRDEIISYCTSVLEVLESLINQKMHQSKARTLSGLLSEHKTLIEQFRNQYPSLKKAVKEVK